MKQSIQARLAIIRPPKPRSEKQREASRRNGTLSRGPVTERGKRNSARNGVRHGVYAKSGPVVSPAAREAAAGIYRRYLTSNHPQNPNERERFEILGALAASLYLSAEAEARILNEEIARQHDLHPQEDPETHMALAWKHLSTHSRVLDDLNRIENRLDRRFRHIVAAIRREKMNSDKTNPATITQQSAAMFQATTFSRTKKREKSTKKTQIAPNRATAAASIEVPSADQVADYSGLEPKAVQQSQADLQYLAGQCAYIDGTSPTHKPSQIGQLEPTRANHNGDPGSEFKVRAAPGVDHAPPLIEAEQHAAILNNAPGAAAQVDSFAGPHGSSSPSYRARYNDESAPDSPEPAPMLLQKFDIGVSLR